AQYYVIKSSTPVNIYVALRHGIWSSTELGNRRLTTAFTKQQETIEATGKHTSCVPSVYLFFSVAASGKFCGVAKMTTPVDMSLNMPVWEQAFRWKGMFGIQWIYVKDLPNNAVKHLRVPANENKPVCNSRDTQELPAGVGEFMLKIFAELPMRSTILEDMIKEEIEKHSQ
ncbi:YTH domain-containing protein, partial [Gaertneriomyces semiglobifer]